MRIHPPASPIESTSRRRLLGMVAAGAAGLLAALLPGDRTRAGHGVDDGADVLHLGRANSHDAATLLASNAPDGPTLGLEHAAGGTALRAQTATGTAASFSSGTGTALDVGGPASIAGTRDGFLAGIDNSASHQLAGGMLINSRGGKPGVEADVFPFDPDHRGVGIQGVSYNGTSYEDGEFAEGPGVGVQGLSGDGPGVEGHSKRAHGVSGLSGTGFGVEGHSDSLVGVGGFSIPDLGVLGVGGHPDEPEAEGDGVGGFSFNSVAGRFVSFNGVGVRAVSPGDAHPALQAASGTPLDPHQEADPDGGLALEVIGKARFSTAGKGTVPPGADSVEVTDVPVTPNSHITVTLSSNPGSRQLHWIEMGEGAFVVHLTSAPPPQRPATEFTYLIVESPEA